MRDYIEDIINVLEGHQLVMLLIGVIGLFVEEALIMIVFEGLSALFVYICSRIRRLIIHFQSLIVFFKLNTNIWRMLVRMFVGVFVICAVFVLTFRLKVDKMGHFIGVGTIPLIFLIIMGASYTVYALYRLYKYNIILKNQYHALKAFYEYLDESSNAQYKTSYFQYLLGKIGDEESQIAWLANVFCYICAPIALITYAYSLFCDLTDLTSLISMMSIVIAIYSLLQSMSADQITRKKLDQIIEEMPTQSQDIKPTPDHTTPPDWIQ